MKRSETQQGYVKKKNIANNLDSLYQRLWAHFVITPEESYYLLNGNKVSESEMDCLYPISDLQKNCISKGKQKDGRIIE